MGTKREWKDHVMQLKACEELGNALTRLLQRHGVADLQTASELADDLEPIVMRLIEYNRDVVTR